MADRPDTPPHNHTTGNSLTSGSTSHQSITESNSDSCRELDQTPLHEISSGHNFLDSPTLQPQAYISPQATPTLAANSLPLNTSFCGQHDGAISPNGSILGSAELQPGYQNTLNTPHPTSNSEIALGKQRPFIGHCTLSNTGPGAISKVTNVWSKHYSPTSGFTITQSPNTSPGFLPTCSDNAILYSTQEHPSLCQMHNHHSAASAEVGHISAQYCTQQRSELESDLDVSGQFIDSFRGYRYQ